MRGSRCRRRFLAARRPIVFLVLILAALGAAGVAVAALTPPVKVGVAKRVEGPYAFSGEQVTADGAPRSFYVKIADKTALNQQVTLEDRSTVDTHGDFRIQWFRNSKNITAATKGSGYQFTLKPGSPKTFRAYMNPLVNHPGAACLFGAFVVQPDDSEFYGFLYVNSSSVCG